ncbi:MAG: MarR family winged helix-turn-helix transcriptional regulator [Bacteroidota bacterium]
MKPEETIDFHIRWAWHSIARLYNDTAEKYDLTVSTAFLLLNIDLKEGTPSTKLGPKMGMEPRSLTRTLASIEEAGLIYRKADKRDKRMVRIYLTEVGKKKRELSKKAVIRFNEYIQEQIPKGKLNTFFEVIDSINKLLKEKTKEEIFNI